ncbi:MAG: Uma2 family endonuclease [Defluviitaleaceae bacterium]|nr:Uma2 family endonuclease [Defluviitaleaceae bacterium]
MSALPAREFTSTHQYTYADYATWPDYPRYELINGEAIQMSAPSRVHQKISMALSIQIGTFLRGKKCEVLAAPFDVRINYNTTDNTVVQPDLVVICDMAKIENGKHCLGTPDMVIEILSESTRGYDKVRKFNVYLEAGVSEYWIVDPIERIVNVHILRDGNYFIKPYGDTDTIPVHVLEGCMVNLAEVFEVEAVAAEDV